MELVTGMVVSSPPLGTSKQTGMTGAGKLYRELRHHAGKARKCPLSPLSAIQTACRPLASGGLGGLSPIFSPTSPPPTLLLSEFGPPEPTQRQDFVNHVVYSGGDRRRQVRWWGSELDWRQVYKGCVNEQPPLWLSRYLWPPGPHLRGGLPERVGTRLRLVHMGTAGIREEAGMLLHHSHPSPGLLPGAPSTCPVLGGQSAVRPGEALCGGAGAAGRNQAAAETLRTLLVPNRSRMWA